MGPERKVVDDVDVLRWSRSKNCIYFEAELNFLFQKKYIIVWRGS